jgi:hypothetical protein
MVRTIGERTHNAREQTDLDPGELFGVTLYFTEAVRLYSYESSQPDRFAPVPTVFEAKSDVEAKAASSTKRSRRTDMTVAMRTAAIGRDPRA